MGIIVTIIIGFVVGLLARALMPGKDPMGFIITTLLGIGGAFLGRFMGEAMGIYKEGESAGFFMSLLGALIILFIHRVYLNKTAPPKDPPV